MAINWPDLVAPKNVEIIIDHEGTRVWVNVDGICAFRAYRIGKLTVVDKRLPSEPPEPPEPETGADRQTREAMERLTGVIEKRQ